MRMVQLGEQWDEWVYTSSYLHQSQLKTSAWWAGITSLTPGVFTSQILKV